jgi:hypothetical protein
VNARGQGDDVHTRGVGVEKRDVQVGGSRSVSVSYSNSFRPHERSAARALPATRVRPERRRSEAIDPRSEPAARDARARHAPRLP